MDFFSSKSKHNLARAFAGLCQDSARYNFISHSAKQEGLEVIGNILKDISRKKLALSSVLYSLMLENISSKKENVQIEAGYPFESKKISSSLQDSAEIEKYEGENLFPYFAKIAKDEGFSALHSTFVAISKICLDKAFFLSNLAQKYASNSLYSSDGEQKWVCSNCGNYAIAKRAWSKCSVCGCGKGFVYPFIVNNRQ